jgi:non-ribosomal peptide synthetase component F
VDATAISCPVLVRVGRTARRYPGHTAVVAADREVGYAELMRRIAWWQRRCEVLRLPLGALVAIVSEGDAELPAAFLGARAAGLVPLMVDTMLPAQRRAAVLTTARPAAILRTAEGEAEALREPRPRQLPAAAGYAVFSSGSSGTPKGIVGHAAGLAHFLDWEAAMLGCAPGTRVAMLTSPSFDVVLRDMLLPLFCGGELHVAAPGTRSRLAAVLPWLAERRVEVLHAVPSLSARWAGAGQTRVESLRHTLFAGEPLYGRHVETWRGVAPATRVFNLYGPSETTLAKFCYEVPADAGPGLQPVGRPLPETSLSLEPFESVEAAEPVERSEQDHPARRQRVVITTAHGSLGYLPDTVRPDDLARLRRVSGLTRFRTQDRGVLDADGNLVVAGRVDSLVKRNGVFVDTARVEAVAAQLPEVRTACCVQLVPSGRVVLVVEGPDPAAALALRRRLQPLLGGDLPDRIVALAPLPLLPGGKVDRRGVRALLEAEEADLERVR